MTKCIGIISYLPEQHREERLRKLNELLLRCDEIFQLPIIIICQNWRGEKLVELKNSKVILYMYPNKLGITGARRELRKRFLSSTFDYLIMLDDDSQLVGDRREGLKYLEQIDSHPDMYGLFKMLLLKLFAISKSVYSLIDFPEGEPEGGDFFEDMWLIMALDKLHHDKKFVFVRNGINEISNSGNDPNSTWFYGQFNKHNIGDNTRSMISKL